ncbi:type I-C CRISPR-associated endonuclease Cas1c [Phytomonospora sp. NPDC050363]|uniref:type I-C CRISPR-associated endonuclease Cas1c n=1 Tax=Phytomonospora sp. NPDC050363 TaxID=3155642 RepID=UPI0033C57ACD
MTELHNTLYVQTPGTSLHLDGDALRIHHPDDDRTRRLPLTRLNQIVLFGGANISQDLTLRCAADGRGVTWLTGMGRFLARISGPTTGNPLLRTAQHNAHNSTPARLHIARAFLAGKLHNSRQVLLRSARDLTGTRQTKTREAADNQARLLPKLPDADNIDTLLGIEGTAARDYFNAFPHLIAAHTGMTFTLRTRRPPLDPVNCLLSFLYGMLRVAVHGALENAGLDPYIGYLHAIRPGKPALALDLMEEFRPLLADRLALTLINRKEITDDHFEHLPAGAVRFTDDGRRAVLNAWQHSRTRTWPHKHLDRDIPAALLPLVQARILARHLRGDLDTYLPWTPA